MQAIPLRRSNTVEAAFLAQQNHHRERRLAAERWREENTGTGIRKYGHMSEWRRSLAGISEVALSNCHLVLWSGEIEIGNPGQKFLVHFDTGTADMWVPSKDCDDTCNAFPDWRKYDGTRSATYEVASDNPALNDFKLFYEDGEWVKGEHAMDVLKLGGTPLRDQIFGQVTSLHNFKTCEAEEGVLGLAFSQTTSHNFPSLIKNLIDSNHLEHSMYSLYLSDEDDYPMTESTFEHADENGNLEYGYHRPTSASSQIVFGGVDQRHYEGCLQWHSLGHFDDAMTGGSFAGFWDFSLDDVRFGGTSVSTSNLAMLDTGSSYIIGPSQAVGKIANLNHASCFNMIQASQPQLVDCSSGVFDAAVIDCDQPFFNLEFVADGRVYVLEKEDLIVKSETSFGEVCVLRLVGSEGIPGWVLGDVFLNKYYAAFDFEDGKVGLALSSKNSQDRCETDEPMDIINHEKFATFDPNPTPPVAPPTKAPTKAPTIVPAKEPTEDPKPIDVTSQEDSFDFADVDPSSNSSKPIVGNQDADPIALFVGFGVGMVAIAMLLWRRHRLQRHRRIEAIIRHAEENSPYKDETSFNDEAQSFVEIDLQTLHRMN